MPENLFAACRINGELVPRRVRLDGTIQDQIETIFVGQEQSFFDGVDDEISFDGRWKPDVNEVLTVGLTPESEMFRHALNMNANAVDDLDLANFAASGIKALFTGEEGDDGRVLVQKFTGAQVLSKKMPFSCRGTRFVGLPLHLFLWHPLWPSSLMAS